MPLSAAHDRGRRVLKALMHGPDGADVVAYLRERTVDRPMGPDASEARMRAHVAQGQFALSLTRLKDEPLGEDPKNGEDDG